MFTKNDIIIFDGAMGTMLQAKGLKLGDIPEMLNISHPETIKSIHEEYLNSGADIILANTFGANRYKAEKAGHTTEELVSSAIKIAKNATKDRKDKYVALDIGPCGKVLAPTGDTEFEEAVEVFAEIVKAGTKAGADLILFETFTDLYELKAGIIAAKENSNLPIFATMSFEENGVTFFGTTVESMVITLESLGVDALGINCSLGPKQLAPIVERILKISTIPVIVQPNAGLPSLREGKTEYDITPEEFALYINKFAKDGVKYVGGCCGTNPTYIKLVKQSCETLTYSPRKNAKKTSLCSPSRQVTLDGDIAIIGERLNPTGKKTLQSAIREENMDYILKEALKQQEQGASILDVNMGLPDIDEPEFLAKVVKELQAITYLPLQLDSSNLEALEKSARIYNGKPLLNSVNGKESSLKTILPIAKKYGCAVLGLTLDDNGIPDTAEERLAIAEKIVTSAEELGIPRTDVLIDCLVMTASAQQKQAIETLKAVKAVKEKLGVRTVLGVSNVSFGLPARPIINRTMLAMALTNGLDAPIMNPGDSGMTETISAYRLLASLDANSENYINKFANTETPKISEKQNNNEDLATAIENGLRQEAHNTTRELLEKKEALTIIEEIIIPTLDNVGQKYEKGITFLPQLIKSAEAAKEAFEILKQHIAKNEKDDKEKGTKVLLATVQGDIHDIGKNIVKVIMENYNFSVIDLGRDVPPEKIVKSVIQNDIKLVGLSALMTTTVESMKETVALLHQECPDVKIMVGGAVLTPELTEYVKADYYVKDAMDGVRTANKI
ncbi:MAG: homocysteine S-methyltransferase family protein [Synergistaceae bacterium]